MNQLIKKLCEREHAVEVSVRPHRTFEAFQAALQREYVHIRFTKTQGGTELGFNLDKDRTDFSKGDFINKSGIIKLCGQLTLDYERVRCVADIDLSTLEGRGHLELLTD